MPIIINDKGEKEVFSCKECKYYLEVTKKCACYPILDIYCTHFIKKELGSKKKIKLGETKKNESIN